MGERLEEKQDICIVSKYLSWDTIYNEEKNKKFTAEKNGRYHRNQVSLLDIMNPGHDAQRTQYPLVAVLLKMHGLNLNWEKYQAKPNWENFTKIWSSSNVAKSWKKKKKKEAQGVSCHI